jgi:hypothetical protein
MGRVALGVAEGADYSLRVTGTRTRTACVRKSILPSSYAVTVGK